MVLLLKFQEDRKCVRCAWAGSCGLVSNDGLLKFAFSWCLYLCTVTYSNLQKLFALRSPVWRWKVHIRSIYSFLYELVQLSILVQFFQFFQTSNQMIIEEYLRYSITPCKLLPMNLVDVYHVIQTDMVILTLSLVDITTLKSQPKHFLSRNLATIFSPT